MFKEERQKYIFHQVNLHNKVLSKDLCEEMNVSEDTIRRDLNEMAESGKLIRVYGGALSVGFNQGMSGSRNIYARKAKIKIAKKALSLIKDGMFVLTTGGTTIMEMINLLPDDLNATFVTGSIPVASRLMNHPSVEVVLVGDRISKSSKLTVGMEAIKKLEQLNADISFIGTNALDLNHGLTDNDWDVVQIKKAIISSARKVVCLTISEKIPSFQPINICQIQELDYLITELNPDDELMRPFVQTGIKVL